ncbi:glutathione S-transferase [Rhizophagus irregularis]|uniref:glutathione transferase n=1 Tax=Rhizophagus irregularis TaxID=588596 RepID=A0A2N0PWR4_9GLOM|nr:glutathione S-transferase [Rhizophagus irregularis]
MTIKIYGFSASSNSLVVFHVLKELGLPYEVIQPAGLEEIKSSDYLATKHPFGKVPVLDDDGFQIYECRAIARYLINKYQGTKTSTILIPSDVHKAALVEQFISVDTSYYNPPISKLTVQLVYFKRIGNEVDLKIVNEAREELEKVLDVYEKLLEGKDYLTGEFTLADLLHIPYTCYAINVAGEVDLLNKRPNVSRWWKNISERECWKNVVTEYSVK